MSRRHLSVVALTVAMLLAAVPAVAESEPRLEIVDRGDDVVIRQGEVSGSLGLQSTDPLDLLVGLDTIRDHSLGVDVLEVWTCGTGGSASNYANQLTDEVGAWFDYHSRGWYRPVFVGRGHAGESYSECEIAAQQQAQAETEGALFAVPIEGGFASAGYNCGFTPCSWSQSYRDGNGRSGFLGVLDGFITTGAHEMGHMISWPHSYTGEDGSDEYDNALDLMSGNYGVSGSRYGSYDEPYGTAAINLYAAGWITPEEVYVHSGNGASLELTTQAGAGWKMAVIRAGNDRYYTLAARAPSAYDPIPDHWSGVEVYEVERCSSGEVACSQSSSMIPGYRRVSPHPAVPFQYNDYPNSYDKPLPHVIRAGDTREVGGVSVQVGQRDGQGFQVSVGSNPEPVPNPPAPSPPDDVSLFTDTAGDVFEGDIEWLADSDITRGCNPPVNYRFCPDDPVTRGQMAAFLHRALSDLSTGPAGEFADDNGHVFEGDIEWLAAAGVTRGCNPPDNDRFCPDDTVTRAQMAAFLHRALPDLPTSGATDFADDDGDVFEDDIEWLAATGVTRGCNPPDNDRFCPHQPVTRGAMAAFLHRALDS